MSKNCCEDKLCNLLLVVQGEKTHYVLIKDFNTFMYITLEIVKGNIFVVIFYEILEQWKY